MNWPVLRVLLVSCWWWTTPSGGATPSPRYVARVQRYSIEQGMRNRFVVDISANRQGFVWLSTYHGAHRFDGYGFEVFDHASHGLASSSLSATREDGDGNVWFFENTSGPVRHLDILPAGAARAQPYPAWAGRPLPFAPEAVVTLGLSQLDGDLLIPTATGALWRGRGRLLRRLYQHPDSLGLTASLVTPRRTVAALCGGGGRHELVELDPSGRVRRRRPVPAGMHLAGAEPDGTLWLNRLDDDPTSPTVRIRAGRLDSLLFRLDATGGGAWVPVPFGRLDARSNPSALPNLGPLQCQYDARLGLFWLAGKGNVFAWHPRHGVVFNLAAEGFPVSELQVIHRVYLDADGNAWVGTSDGFLVISLGPSRFNRYLYSPDPVGAARASVRGLVPVGGHLWANSLTPHWLNLRTGADELPPGCPPGLQLAATLGREGDVWTVANEALRFSVRSGAYRRYALPQARNNNLAWALWQRPDGTFLLGHEQGLSTFNPRDGQNRPFRGYGPFPQLARSRVNGIVPDSLTGGAWLATSSGLYRLDAGGRVTARFATNEPAPRRLPFDHVLHLHADRQRPGLLWLATLGGGLIRWETATGHARQYTTRDGLPHDVVYCAYEDAHHRLWLSSDYGIVCFDKATERTRAFLPRDGITHEEFNRTAHAQAPDGRLFFGGLNGITAFYPELLDSPRNHHRPLHLIRYQQLDGRTGALVDRTDSLRRTGRITLDPDSRLFALSFSLLDFRDARRCRYAYRLVGWQDDWLFLPDNTLRINGLPPGKYRLEVRGQTSDGRWAARPFVLPVVVEAPVYQRPWFLAVVAAVFLALVWGAYRLRTQRLRAEKVRLEREVRRRTAQIERQADALREADRLKTRFFANVSHEFRTPLTLLLGPVDFLRRRHPDDSRQRDVLDLMERNARQLLDLVNGLLDTTKADAARLELLERPAYPADIVERTVAAFQSAAEHAGVRLFLENEVPDQPLLLDVGKLETVLKNLISNALRFTAPGGRVAVRIFTPNAHTLALSVADTGTGIHPDDLPHLFERYYQSRRPEAALTGGTGLGLSIVRECCQLWGGTTTVESTPGQGSTFTLTYPRRYAPDSVATTPAELLLNVTRAEPIPEPIPIHGERLLVVEDHPDMARYLRLLLAPRYALYLTRDGLEALDYLRQLPDAQRPDLIVSDLMMPRLDGLSLLTSLRADETLRDIPFVLLTARTALEDKIQGLSLGAADYVIKPFDERELLTRVRNLLDRNRERTTWRRMPVEPEDILPVGETETWLQDMEALVRKHLNDNLLQVNLLADASCLSERQLLRRMKEATGLSPNQFIQEVRLQTARHWLETKRFTTVKEVCFAVGFRKPEYFSRLFAERFGKNPSDLLPVKLP